MSWNVSRTWVRVVGVAVMSPGLGMVEVGDASTVLQHQDAREWSSRTMLGINLVLFGGKSAKEAVADLMLRDKKVEISDTEWE